MQGTGSSGYKGSRNGDGSTEDDFAEYLTFPVLF